ncbi:hypothetical protein PCL_13131 [Purpureocillium lilacinum]|uniref:Uncharacterized protein n=1 Tax=Purpureocillium lilacinum TaxID=33203 RepID=A0A2U3E898_PURLI|nr:hypothetical protein PCL_13131 [Purpureocillium lilacinum]
MGALYAGLDELTSRQPPFVASRLVLSLSRLHVNIRAVVPVSDSSPLQSLALPLPSRTLHPARMQVFVTAQHQDSANKEDAKSHQMPMWSRPRFIVRTSQPILASGWSCISHTANRKCKQGTALENSRPASHRSYA